MTTTFGQPSSGCCPGPVINVNCCGDGGDGGPDDPTDCEFASVDATHDHGEVVIGDKVSEPPVKTDPTISLVETGSTSGSSNTPNNPATFTGTDWLSHDVALNGAYDYSNGGVNAPAHFPGPWTLSFPTTAGNLYVVHFGWGDTQDANPGYPKSADAVATSSQATCELCRHDSWTGLNSGNTTAATLIVAIDGTGNTETVTLDLGYDDGDVPRGQVAATVTCVSDIQCADLGPASGLLAQGPTSSSGTAIPTDPFTMPAGSSCGLWYGTARHAISTAGDNAGANYSDAAVSAGTTTEAYDAMTGNGNDAVCAIGQTGGLWTGATGGTDTITISSTQNAGPPNQLDMGGYCFIPIIDPVDSGAATASGTVEVPDTTLANECDEDQMAVCTITADIAIAEGGTDDIVVTPIVNGTPGTSISVSGTVSETSMMTIPAGGSGTCALSFDWTCTGEGDPATSLSITNVTVSIA